LPRYANYAWKGNPVCARELANPRLLPKLKQVWLESGCVYGYRKITLDIRDLGEGCGKHRVYGLLKREGLRSQTAASAGQALNLSHQPWCRGLSEFLCSRLRIGSVQSDGPEPHITRQVG
jgi:hypothetical protein